MKEAAPDSMVYCWSPITDFMPRSATDSVERVTSRVVANTSTAATQARRNFKFADDKRDLGITMKFDENAEEMTKYYIFYIPAQFHSVHQLYIRLKRLTLQVGTVEPERFRIGFRVSRLRMRIAHE